MKKKILSKIILHFIHSMDMKIKNNKNILIAAHGNSLRATMIKVGLYQPEEISNIEIPTGSPFVINYENGKIIELT